MTRSGEHGAASRSAAAIHDLGYKRYLGTRRPQSTRWRVLVRNTVAGAWRGWWRMKLWVVGCAITTFVFGALMLIFKGEAFEQLTRQSGLVIGWVDAIPPYSIKFFALFALLLAATTAAGAVARDMRAGAFEFYFSRPVRPLDYLLGQLVGSTLVVATALLFGPLLLSLWRVGLARDFDDILAALALVPRMALVGVVASLAYAVVALAFSSLSRRPRMTIAMWVGFIFVFAGLWEGLAALLHSPDLTALSLPNAVEGFALGLFEVSLPSFASRAPGMAASFGSLAGHVSIGLVILIVRVRQAERAGLGGG